MLDAKNKRAASEAAPPFPGFGFEADLVKEVEGLVRQLPSGTACLRIGRIPGHPEWPEPYFEITPSNPRAARFAGFGVQTDLQLEIAEAEREFVGFTRGGTVVRGLSWREELRLIWLAVAKGGFAQKIYRDSRGRAIGCSAKLPLDGRVLVLRSGRRAEKLFGRSRVDLVTYEPYV